MTPITEILNPAHVRLGLEAPDEAGAVDAVLALLEGDRRVLDFFRLSESVKTRSAGGIVEHGCGICIAHGRTESISSLVMAAGRFPQGVPAREGEVLMKLIFVAGIPAAFSSEYLRTVGAIARICRDRHQLERLLAAKTASQFVDLLGVGEAKL
jgi:mannitol/fructose-specific phosphotransferase system IIA component (Ntr-type)